MFKNFISEFKKFAMRGNVIDMAVGIIIGAAFGKIVDSLVKDVLMPPIGLLLGKVDFSDLKLVLTSGENPVSINYGLFINALQERMTKEEAEEKAAEPTTKTCPYCCTEIPLKACRCPHCTSELK